MVVGVLRKPWSHMWKRECKGFCHTSGYPSRLIRLQICGLVWMDHCVVFFVVVLLLFFFFFSLLSAPASASLLLCFFLLQFTVVVWRHVVPWTMTNGG